MKFLMDIYVNSHKQTKKIFSKILDYYHVQTKRVPLPATLCSSNLRVTQIRRFKVKI